MLEKASEKAFVLVSIASLSSSSFSFMNLFLFWTAAAKCNPKTLFTGFGLIPCFTGLNSFS